MLALELAKYLAFLLMVLDHANAYLLGGAYPWMWELGRVVFPMFAVVLGLGLRGAGSGRACSVAGRIAAVAVLAEVCAWPLIDAGVRSMSLNVCATLAGGCLLVYAQSRSGAARAAMVAAVVLGTWVAEYGFIGAALVWAVAYGRMAWALACVATLCVWQATPMPLLGVVLVEWLSRAFPVQAGRSPRLLFGALYAGQFLAFSAMQ